MNGPDLAPRAPVCGIPGLDGVPIVGIVRGCPLDHLLEVVGAAVAEGVRVVEVTLDSPNALGQIRTVSRAFPDLTVGAGTVTRAPQVRDVVDAGARFVVSPITRNEVIDVCGGLDVPCIPGAATPTEIIKAWESGAAAVKVFPALALGGPGYLKAILGPLGEPPLIPTGGVRAETAKDYLAAGAAALGAGTDLFSPKAMAAGDVEEIRARARRWVEAVA
jgi:2-dehydro-3-deoxyphosphogluconate aldolase/(4S)-4-hydroxy-2-oxoglutarate aldolase